MTRETPKEDLEKKVQSAVYILPVQDFDQRKFQGYEVRLAEQGITISTLEEEAQDPNCYAKLYTLALELDEEIEGLDIASMNIEQFKKMIAEHPKLLPKGFFIAKEGTEYIGLSMLIREDTYLHQSMTATHKDYRRKGIATALKLKTIAFAKEYGAESLKTVNTATNTAIIALNEKLGFKRQ